MLRREIFIYWTILFSLNLIVLKSEEENEYPIDWSKAVSSINDYPLVSNCSSLRGKEIESCRWIDPWTYLGRMGIYKILIEGTTPLMPFSLSNNRSNILFGLPLQFSWQFSSKRLFSDKNGTISTDSWWASANYYLSVIPFLAAYNLGLFGQVPIQLNSKESFCSTIDQCFHQIPQTMELWTEFFVNLSQTNSCHSSNIDDEIIDRCYLKGMWSAHLSSIKSALPLIQSKADLLPSINEKNFGLSWAHLVDFIGESRLNTNLSQTFEYQNLFLPSRMLTDDDKPPNIDDLPLSVNKALELLLSVNDNLYSKLEYLWKRIRCNFQSRLMGQQILKTIVFSKLTAMKYYIEAIMDSNIYPCDKF